MNLIYYLIHYRWFISNYSEFSSSRATKFKSNSKRIDNFKIASSRYLFKNFVGINDNQENVLKVIKANKLLEEEIARATNKIDKKY